MMQTTRNRLIRVQTTLMTLTCCTYVAFGTRSQNAFLISHQWLRSAQIRRREFSGEVVQRYIGSEQSTRCQWREHTTTFSTKASSALENPQLEESSLSKWSFLPRKQDDSKLIRNILVCGDGDLSFSADVAEELENLNIKLFATVLEDEMTHNEGMFNRN